MQLNAILPKALTIFMLTTFISTTEAAERLLCYVTSDIDKEVAKMVYEMDEDGRAIKHLYKERYLNNKLIERVEMKTDDLLGDGLILHKKDKYVTVRLYSHNFDEQRGGVLYLDTLYSGLSGERREYPIEVQMDGEEATMIQNGQAFTKMHFIAKKSPILGAIGIERIKFTAN